MRFIKWLVSLGLLLIVACAALYFGLPYLNSFQKDGAISLPGLQKPVTVVRDGKGMAYIKAQSLHDVFMAQGFVTAQDRLFQMQLTRLLAEGRISELAGEKAKPLDIKHRTIGIHRNAKKQAKLLDDRSRSMIESYVDGINAFIETRPKEIPIEFKLAGIRPEPWRIEDSLAVLYYMAWTTSANIKTEIVAQALADKLGPEKSLELFPINVNPDDPETSPKSAALPSIVPGLGVCEERSIMALGDAFERRFGSNNWAISGKLSSSGKPIVADDTHLDARILPGVWHPIGLSAPGIHAVGVMVPGIPGIVVGRNEGVAFGVTNAYADVQDLYVETVDPKDPSRYLEGTESLPFTVVTETLKIKDKNAPGGYKEESIKIRSTRRGPVVSGALPGLGRDKLFSLRWAAAETMGATVGVDRLMSAKSAAEFRDALKDLPMLVLNFVFADTSGAIGWQVAGKVPIRTAGAGTVPYEVKDGKDNWTGWIPFGEMPHSDNPKRGWVGTCNHKTVRHDYPYYYSSHMSPSYRYRRLIELLDSPGAKSLDDNWSFQRDNVNLMAKSLAPIMARSLKANEDTRRLGEILSQWDFHDAMDKAAPTVFQAVYCEFARQVFEDELGPQVADIMLKDWYYWQERLQRMIQAGTSPWFDNVNTTDKREGMDDMFHLAAQKASRKLGDALGSDPEKWDWGRAHTLELVNPIRRSGFGKSLLGSGKMPMGGSGETLYRASYNFDKPYSVSYFAAVRMVADLADNDKVAAVIPGGVSGRTFDPHMKDQIRPFMDGAKIYWWFSDAAIEKHAKHRLTLEPK